MPALVDLLPEIKICGINLSCAVLSVLAASMGTDTCA